MDHRKDRAGSRRHGVTVISGMARGIDSVATWGRFKEEKNDSRPGLWRRCDLSFRKSEPLQSNHRTWAVLSEFPIGSPPEGDISRGEIGSSVAFPLEWSLSRLAQKVAPSLPLTMPWSKKRVFAIPGMSEPKAVVNKPVDQRRGKTVESSEDILEEILPQWRRRKRSLPSWVTSAWSHGRGKNSLQPVRRDTHPYWYHHTRESIGSGKVSSLLLHLELKDWSPSGQVNASLKKCNEPSESEEDCFKINFC